MNKIEELKGLYKMPLEALFLGGEPFSKKIFIQDTDGRVEDACTEIISLDVSTRFNSKFSLSLRVSLQDKDFGGEIKEIFFKLPNGDKIVVGENIDTGGRQLVLVVNLSVEVGIENCVMIKSDKSILARILLGQETAVLNDISLLWRQEILPEQIPFTIDASRQGGGVSVASVLIKEDKIVIRGDFPRQAREVVLLIKGEPVARMSLITLQASVLALSGDTAQNNTIGVGSAWIRSVRSIEQANISPLDIRTITTTQSVEEIDIDPILRNFDRDARFIAEPYGRIAALVSDRQAHIIGIRNGIPSIIATVELRGRQIFLSGGDRVVMATNTELEIFSYSSKTGLTLERVYPLRPNTQRVIAVTTTNLRISIVTEALGRLRIENDLLDGTDLRIDSLDPIGDIEVVAQSRIGTFVLAKNRQAQIYDANGLLGETEEIRNFLINNPAFTVIGVSNNFLLLEAGQGLAVDRAIVSLRSARLTPLTRGVEFRTFRDEAIAIFPGGTRFFYSYEPQDDSLRITSAAMFNNPDEIIKLEGYYLTRHADGTIRSYMEIPSTQRLVHQRFPRGVRQNIVAEGINFSRLEGGEVEIEIS